MKKTNCKSLKKVLGIMLAGVLAFGTACMGVSADGDTPDTESAVENVALNKAVTAGIYYDRANLKNLNDGDGTTFVWPNGNSTGTDNADGVVSTAQNAWYTVDLGAKYKIEYVKLIDNTNTWSSGYNVKILASNDKNFETGVYEIINSGVDQAIPMGENINCDSDEYYRYVKIQKFAGEKHSGYQYSEFEVYAYPENVVAPDNVALNKAVTAGGWTSGNPKTNINDGKEDTVVWDGGGKNIYTDNADGVVSDKTNAWYIIDLGAKYKIEYVKIADSKNNTWTSDRNIKILASNDKNFETGVYEIVSCGASDNHLLGNNITCNSDEYYRYVKLQKFEGETTTYGYQYSEFEVYAYPENVIAPDNVALNKAVTAGGWTNGNPKANINDGKEDTVVWDGDGNNIYIRIMQTVLLRIKQTHGILLTLVQNIK